MPPSVSTSRRRYDLIAVDLDGTLLDPSGNVGESCAEAIQRAMAEGVRVVVCTGRGYNECSHITRRIGHREPVVVAGGAMIADAHSGRTIHRFAMDPALVRRLVDSMTSHGHAALVLKDITGVRDSGLHDGHDYLVVSPRGHDAIDPVSRWWFKEHNIAIRVVPTLDHDDHPDHTVRVGICGTKRRTAPAADALRHSFAHDVMFHHFGAVVPGTHGSSDDERILILEAFDRQVNKWAAVRWLAQRQNIPEARICAIGNDINDIDMLRHAGLGIAMGNAIPEAAAVAKVHTLDNTSGGVAHAIDRVLSGEW